MHGAQERQKEVREEEEGGGEEPFPDLQGRINGHYRSMNDGWHYSMQKRGRKSKNWSISFLKGTVEERGRSEL